MTNEDNHDAPNKSFWIIGYTALAWNIIGVISFIMTVTLSADALELMSVEQRALYTEVPLIITAAYAIAVFGGTLACILLLLRKPVTVIAFIVSLVAIVIQMGYSLLFSSVIEVQGMSALALPLSIIVVAAYLTWYSIGARKKGWYR